MAKQKRCCPKTLLTSISNSLVSFNGLCLTWWNLELILELSNNGKIMIYHLKSSKDLQYFLTLPIHYKLQLKSNHNFVISHWTRTSAGWIFVSWVIYCFTGDTTNICRQILLKVFLIGIYSCCSLNWYNLDSSLIWMITICRKSKQERN